MDEIKSILIAGIDYKVSFKENLARDNGTVGTFCGNNTEIRIDSGIPEQRKEKTLLHEILEGINYEYDLDLEHRKISVLETAIFTMLKDNKKFINKIINKK